MSLDVRQVSPVYVDGGMTGGEAPRIKRSIWRRRWVVLVGVGFVGLILGAALGASGSTIETVTEAVTEVETAVSTAVQTETVTKTVTRTVEKQAPAIPNGPGVATSLGDYKGIFRFHGVRIGADEFGSPGVLGQYEYLGGSDCDRVGYVQVDATFFRDGEIVETDFTNNTTAPEDTRVGFSIGADSNFDRAEVLLSRASCD